MDRAGAAALIEKLVAEHGQLTGSKLSSLLRKVDANWSPDTHGVPTLSAFIASFVPQIIEVGRSGLDPLYGLPNSSSPTEALLDDDLWRVWASPNSKLVVEISSASGQVRATDRRQTTTADWVRIASPDADAHRALARDFLALQFPDGDAALSALITPDANWWQSWFKHIKQRKLIRVWSEFRRARLLASFENALSSHDLTQEAQASALSALSRWTNPGADLQQALAQRVETLSSNELRSIASLVIEEMNEEELAALRLPLGLVLRAIKRSR